MPDGWEALEEPGRRLEASPEPDAHDLIEKMHVELLNNPLGRKFLGYLKAKYLDQPVCVPGVGSEVGFHREGQNDVVREMIKQLTKGLTPKQ